MMRTTLVAGAALLVAAALVAPGGAAMAAQPDGGSPVAATEPGYGALVATLRVDGMEETFVVCSGSLLAPDRFLTAGHCFTVIEGMFDDVVWAVSFDAQLPPAAEPDPRFPPVELDRNALRDSDLVPVTEWTVAPTSRVTGNAVFDDVAVARLARPVTDRAPVSVAPVGWLDRGPLRGTTYDLVGYGVDARWATGSAGEPGVPVTYLFDGARAVTTMPFRSLTRTFLYASQNATVTGQGGFCSSDSGAPVLDTGPGEGTPVVVAIAVWSDDVCRSLAVMQRLDTPEMASFLAATTA